MDGVVKKITGILKHSENLKIYKIDTVLIGNVSETAIQYGQPKTWWICDCGSKDVQVFELERADLSAGHAELICRECRKIWRTTRPL